MQEKIEKSKKNILLGRKNNCHEKQRYILCQLNMISKNMETQRKTSKKEHFTREKEHFTREKEHFTRGLEHFTREAKL